MCDLREPPRDRVTRGIPFRAFGGSPPPDRLQTSTTPRNVGAFAASAVRVGVPPTRTPTAFRGGEPLSGNPHRSQVRGGEPLSGNPHRSQVRGGEPRSASKPPPPPRNIGAFSKTGRRRRRHPTGKAKARRLICFLLSFSISPRPPWAVLLLLFS